MVNHLARYLRGSKQLPIRSAPQQPEFRNRLVAYADAGYAEQDDYHSQSAGIVFNNGMLVDSWSKTEKTVALSTMEAELMALSRTVQAVQYLRTSLQQLGIKQDAPSLIYEDNQSVIAYIKNRNISQRNRHIGVRYVFIQQAIDRGEIELLWCPTEQMVADLGTKNLSAAVHHRLLRKVFDNDGIAHYQP